jgi:hypothetical protein
VAVAVAIAGAAWYYCRKRKLKRQGGAGAEGAATFMEQKLSYGFSEAEAEDQHADIGSMPSKPSAPTMAAYLAAPTLATPFDAPIPEPQAAGLKPSKPPTTIPAPLPAVLASSALKSAHSDLR